MSIDKPMKPLFMIPAYGLVLINGEDGYYNLPDDTADKTVHGPGCLPGIRAGSTNMKDFFGREFSAHWVVPPGKQINNTLVTQIMSVPFDTTVHFIGTHIHPFAETLTLKDLTLDKVVFKSDITLSKEKIKIDEITYMSSEEGIPLYKDHEYQLISVYNNTTKEDQDAMAVMYLYALDKEFKK